MPRWQVEVACYGLSFVNGQVDSTTQYYGTIFNLGGVLRLYDCLLLSNVVDRNMVLCNSIAIRAAERLRWVVVRHPG